MLTLQTPPHEVLAELRAIIATAPKTTAKRVIAGIENAIAVIEHFGTTHRDEQTGSLEAFQITARHCANELEEALALKVGVMDSESKAAAVNSQRMGAMQSVAARLREA